ncbi:hypothetical protein [Phaeodactylibacter xiamenensis]|uniref:hypothetical protein n=1 Tax=Phaeodactylibacter xiamenensis TaxID=1524460 RepID=UPI0024A8C70B|nr:hypothetical protein [Phaeodactylibacter xiamenensis]
MDLSKLIENPQAAAEMVQSELYKYMASVAKELNQPKIYLMGVELDSAINFVVVDPQDNVMAKIGDLLQLLKNTAKMQKSFLERQQVKAAFLIPQVKNAIADGEKMILEGLQKEGADAIGIFPDHKGKKAHFFIIFGTNKKVKPVDLGDFI